MRHPQDEYDIAIAQLKTIIRFLTSPYTRPAFAQELRQDINSLITRIFKAHDLLNPQVVEWKITAFELFSKYAVKASSIEDFLTRYYKPERYTGRGKEYAAILLASHKQCLEKDGIDIISHFDSVTGNVVAYIPNNEKGN